jgi:uncharacterized protein (TIRG00374 family)
MGEKGNLKKYMKNRLIKYLLAAGFIGLFIYFYVKNPETFSKTLEFSWPIILVALAFQLVSLYLNGYILRYIMNKKGSDIGHLDGFYSAFLSSFGNYFLPLTGGAVLRAVYLKKQHALSYKSFISISYGLYIISFLATSSLSLIALAYLYFAENIFSLSLTLVMAAIFVFTASLSTTKWRADTFIIEFFEKLLGNRALFINRKLQPIIQGWRDLLELREILRMLVFTTIIAILIRVLFYYMAFAALGVSTSLVYMIIFTMLISLSLYLTITPGSLGIRETLLILYSGTLTISESDILAVNLLDRGSIFFILVLLFLAFQYFLSKPLHETLRNRPKREPGFNG